MSTKKEQKSKQDNIGRLFPIDLEKGHRIAEALDTVQRNLDAEIEARKEERFYLICIIVIIIDIFTFQDMQTWSAPVSIAFIEFIFLISLARKLGVDHIWTLTEKIIDKWNGSVGKGG